MLLSCFLFVTGQIFPQVGINTDNPNSLTELEITNIIDGGGNIIPKGIMVPRMSEADRDKISISDASSANSLLIYNTDEDCYNYYSKTDREWKSLCGTMGSAVFDPVSCSDIKPHGTYIEETSVTPNEYLSVTLNVTKEGSYTLTVTSGNGYSFYVTGVAMEKGPLTVRIPAQGQPVNVGWDNLTIEGFELADNCEPKNQVVSNVAEYSINCNSIVVNGRYQKGKALTGTNTITVNINISKAGSYYISTPVTNGISFEGRGDVTPGITSVTLTAVDGSVVTLNQDFNIQIKTNSPSGNTECEALIPVTLLPMKYAIIGNDVWSWATSARRSVFSANGSFGENGKVRIESFSELWSETDVNTAASRLNSTSAQQPDVVLYFAFGANPNETISKALASYIKKGGCVMYGSSSIANDATQFRPVDIFLKGIFGQGPNVQNGSGSSAKTDAEGWSENQITRYDNTPPNNSQDDNCYQINNLPDDPIINGPFGNLAGGWWGEDNDSWGSVLTSQLPPNSIQICSAYNNHSKRYVDSSKSIVWYNDQMNLVYFGDSTGASTSSTSRIEYPTVYTNGKPVSKMYGNWPQENLLGKLVSNAALEMNALAFLVKKAAVSGINPY